VGRGRRDGDKRRGGQKQASAKARRSVARPSLDHHISPRIGRRKTGVSLSKMEGARKTSIEI
jgi:hypothetical protein